MFNFRILAPITIGLICLTTYSVSAQMDHASMNHAKAKVVHEKNGIKLTTVEGSPDYPTAQLTLTSPKSNALVPEGNVLFQYELKNYDLGKQTGEHHDCANSAKGQHIHLILNNEPYLALYSDTFTKDLKPGGYLALSFLSRSYHESVKHKGAYGLQYFSVGGKEVKNDVDLKAPMLFFSRPKGDYKGDAETKNVLLDYYLVNCTLSKKGYKVKATIDGTEFVFTKWEPYFMQGLALGPHTIKLELVDKDGKTVQNKFNPVERKINLMAADPAK